MNALPWAHVDRIPTLDLFSGIGGISLALDPYARPVAYCEIDPYCRAVLAERMAEGLLEEAPILGDVRAIGASDLRERPELITGGFPCQDISVAGRGAGLEGERSGLFFEILRLAKEIEPAFIFLENVPAIRSRGAERVVCELANLRYDVRWAVLSAFDVGAPHKRDRWFLLAHSQRSRGRSFALGEETGCAEAHNVGADIPDAHGIDLRNVCRRSGGQDGQGTSEPRHDGAHGIVADSRGARLALGQGNEQRNALAAVTGGRWWAIEPDVGRVAHGVPSRVDRLKGLGNAVVPAQAREAFERLAGLKPCE